MSLAEGWNAVRKPVVEEGKGSQLDHSIRRKLMLWTIVVILIILWLLGFFGRNISPSFPRTGSWIHLLVVIAVILVILKLLAVV
jgi:uncharacterized protein involved in cysteine biosynthesis